MADAKPVDFVRSPLQTTAVGPYGLLSAASGSQTYQNTRPSPQSYVSQANFTPFTLPPPGFATTATATTTTTAPVTRDT